MEGPCFFNEFLANVLEKLDDFIPTLRTAYAEAEARGRSLEVLARKVQNRNLDKYHAFRRRQILYDENELGGFLEWFQGLRRKYSQFFVLRNSVILLMWKIYFSEALGRKYSGLESKLESDLKALNNFVTPPLHRFVCIDLKPIYSIYQHNYDPRFFPKRIPVINSLFLSRLFQSLSRKDSNGIDSLATDLEPVITSLVNMRYQAMRAFEDFDLLRRNPPKEIVESYSGYKKLRETERLLKRRIVDDENSEGSLGLSFERLREACGLLSKSIQLFESKSNANAERFLVTDAMLKSVNLKTRVYGYIHKVSKSAEFVSVRKLCDRYENWINTERKIRLRFSGSRFRIDRPELEHFCREMTQCTEALDVLLKDLNMLESEKEKILRHLMGRSRPFGASSPTRRASEMVGKVHSMSSVRGYQRKQIIDHLVQVLDEFSRLPRPLSRLCGLLTPPDGLHEWKSKILEGLRELKAKKLAQLEELKEKCREKFQEVPELMGGVLENEQRKSEMAFASLRVYLSCPVCDREVSHCLAKCGHLLCRNCAQEAEGRCPVCQKRVGTDSIVEIKWK
jgi:hypothetical protein